jgi:hypothetical protein
MVAGVKDPIPATLACLSGFLEKTMDVFADEIGFNVDFITNSTGAQISMLQGERDDRYGKPISPTIINR